MPDSIDLSDLMMTLSFRILLTFRTAFPGFLEPSKTNVDLPSRRTTGELGFKHFFWERILHQWIPKASGFSVTRIWNPRTGAVGRISVSGNDRGNSEPNRGLLITQLEPDFKYATRRVGLMSAN